MADSPYYDLIRCYFPPEEWSNANCVSLREANPTDPSYPNVVKGEGQIICGGPAIDAKSYGLFGILDACWNPDMAPDSYFTAAQWANVLDPTVNTWMASVIWSRNGWRAWTTCPDCGTCNVPGGPVPHPRNPVEKCAAPGARLGLLVAAAAGVLLVGLGYRDRRMRGVR